MSMQTISNISYLKGTQEDYDELLEKNSNTFYITTDTKRIYLGDELYNTIQEDPSEAEEIDTSSFYSEMAVDGTFIVKAFPSVATMEAAFQLGDSYTDVKYGEYVMISVPDEQESAQEYNTNNGKIYKRTFDGSEYIGRISGPAGSPSYLNIITMSEINEYSENLTAHTASISSENLVPGKVPQSQQDIENEVEPTYNDAIIWKFYHQSVSNADQVNLGIQIPYPTFTFSIENANIENPTIIDVSETENGQKKHPFHTDLKIQLPNKHNGTSIDSLQIIQAGINDGVNYGDTSSEIVTNLRNQNKPIIVYQKTSYDDNNVPTSEFCYVSEFILFDNIDISDEGYLQFWLPNSNSPISSHLSIVPEITDVSLSNTGIISLIWTDFLGNQHTKAINSTPVKWITDINYTPQGGLSFSWNDNSEATEINPVQSFITDITIFNNSLYKSFIGIDKEISLITGIDINEIANATDSAVNAHVTGFGTYHKDIQNGQSVWYKKIFDFSSNNIT